MIVAGLNANGFDRNTWIASGKQGIFEEDNLLHRAMWLVWTTRGFRGCV